MSMTEQEIHNNIMQIINTISINKSHKARKLFEQGLKYCNYKNKLYGRRYEFTENEIKGIITSNIRHRYSNYQDALDSMDKVTKDCNKSDKLLNYKQIKNATLSRIGNEYSYLKDYCDNNRYKLDMAKYAKKPKRKSHKK